MPKQYGSIATITEEQLKLYEKALEHGMPKTKATNLLGITPTAWGMARKEYCDQHGYDWEQITPHELQQLQNQPKLTPREQNILKILQIEKSGVEEKGELYLLNEIRKAEPWQSKAWLLERTRGYTVKTEIQHTGEISQPLQVTVTQQEINSVLNKYEEMGITPELEGEIVEDD